MNHCLYKKVIKNVRAIVWRCPHSAICGSASRIRTCDNLINSQVLYQLSYGGIVSPIRGKQQLKYESMHVNLSWLQEQSIGTII